MTTVDLWVNRVFLLLIVAGGIWAFLTLRSARQMAVDAIDGLKTEMRKQAEELRLSRVAEEAVAKIASARVSVEENRKKINEASSVGSLPLDDAMGEYERARVSSTR